MPVSVRRRWVFSSAGSHLRPLSSAVRLARSPTLIRMPEGDTIFRAARTLHRALAGKAVVRFESMLPALDRVHDDTPITGRTIERVDARGKHLLMQFSGDLVLRTHM